MKTILAMEQNKFRSRFKYTKLSCSTGGISNNSEKMVFLINRIRTTENPFDNESNWINISHTVE
jgi:hypothetical protein